jgi:hypothetical protein
MKTTSTIDYGDYTARYFKSDDQLGSTKKSNGHDTASHNGSPLQTVASWPVMANAAYHGLAGNVVKTIEPHSEADPFALLIQFLTLAGNVFGREPFRQVESDHHHTNLFSVLVGTSSKGRKGTSFSRVRAVAKHADEIWAGDRIKGGLSSGEGLINEVRDERQEWDKKENGSRLLILV